MPTAEQQQLVKRIAIAAAIAGISGYGLYYLLNRARRGGSQGKGSADALTGLEQKTVKDLKELGNQLFSSKKYADAIMVFTKAIEKIEEGSEPTKAMCYQNRAAAKERLGSYTNEDMLADCDLALKDNPGYGKAYLRRGRLMQKMSKPQDALVDIFCALHLDPSLDKQTAALMPPLMDEVTKLRQKSFQTNVVQGGRKAVRHEKVYAWLHKTVHKDVLRNEVVNTKFEADSASPFAQAVQLIRSGKYDEVADVAVQEDGEKRLEALLLAARFYAYQNLVDKATELIATFDKAIGELIEPEQESKKSLIASKHVLLIELARTKEQVMKAFYEAIATDLRNADFYAMAAFRLVLCGEADEAVKLLAADNIETNDNIKLLFFTLSILASTEAQQDMALLHKNILNLENFVTNMSPQSPYGQTLLAKIYATFGNDTGARELLEGVLKEEPNVSMHWFDRSCMASSGEEASEKLEKCLSLEPHHTEANLMAASLKVNEYGPKLPKRSEFESLLPYLDRAEATFEGSIDFPIVDGVFRLRDVLEAKKTAAVKLGIWH